MKLVQQVRYALELLSQYKSSEISVPSHPPYWKNVSQNLS